MMDEARWERTPTRSRGRASTFNVFLLGLLSLFETAFDRLSLVAAILGGVARDTDSTQGASIAPKNTTGVPPQLVVQNVAHETPAGRPVGITIIGILLGLLGIF